MRSIRREVEVDATPAAVWDVWATATGAVTFFAPEARIGNVRARWGEGLRDGARRPESLRPGDPYELLFLDPGESAEGGRGSEGCRVLALIPGELLAFSWNAPPQYAMVRAAAEKAWVVVEFRPSGDGVESRTRVRLTHIGFGEGAEWDAVFAYFERAWGTVLARLSRRFVTGPIDWDAPAATGPRGAEPGGTRSRRAPWP